MCSPSSLKLFTFFFVALVHDHPVLLLLSSESLLSHALACVPTVSALLLVSMQPPVLLGVLVLPRPSHLSASASAIRIRFLLVLSFGLECPRSSAVVMQCTGWRHRRDAFTDVPPPPPPPPATATPAHNCRSRSLQPPRQPPARAVPQPPSAAATAVPAPRRRDTPAGRTVAGRRHHRKGRELKSRPPLPSHAPQPTADATPPRRRRTQPRCRRCRSLPPPRAAAAAAATGPRVATRLRHAPQSPRPPHRRRGRPSYGRDRRRQQPWPFLPRARPPPPSAAATPATGATATRCCRKGGAESRRRSACTAKSVQSFAGNIRSIGVQSLHKKPSTPARPIVPSTSHMCPFWARMLSFSGQAQ